MKRQKPVYLLAGGPGSRRKTPDPLIQAILQETGKSHPSVAYVGAASNDDKSFFRMIAQYFTLAGADQVQHAAMVSPGADPEKARDMMTAADAVFISGGDVEAGMQVLEEKRLTGFLADLYQQGKLFFGLSAGSIMLAREWVRWPDPDDDSSAELFPCLGLASVLCDTHAEEDDWEELKAALELKGDGSVGYGIATGTGLKVYPDGQVEAMGSPVPRYLRKSGKVVRQTDLKPV